MREIDASLRRLGTDYVDLYQIHRWDPATPIEETLEALNDVVRAGKARYIGASSMYAWQFAKALHVSEQHGWAKFVTMQNLYNLLYREEEREMLPLCLDAGVGSIPWSPLATGRLVRPWEQTSLRPNMKDPNGRGMFVDADQPVVEANLAVAKRLGVPPAQVALAWVMRHPAVTAPIVGVTKPGQVDDAIAAIDLQLGDDDVAELESGYVPHVVYGHR
jgi:aryl-alcohol dehydrogenase (NADP+)